MIQFIGLSFIATADGARAVATVVDRKARVLGSGSAAVAGVKTGAGGALEVRPGEWVRAGSLALRDAFFQVPARKRRVWGFSIAGPPGWIALDPDLEPLGPLWIAPRPGEELVAWLGEDARRRAHVYAVLPPKDYFRYAVSGALATDVTQAGSLGPLGPGAPRFASAALEARGLSPAWFPPVFDSAVTTGRISEEGIRHTGLPGGLWVVAGADGAAGPLVSAHTTSGALLVSEGAPGTLELRAVAAGRPEGAPPAGFEELEAPFAGHRVLRTALGHGEEAGGAGGALREAVERLRREAIPGLRPPERVVIDFRGPGEPAWAAGALAAAPLPAERSPCLSTPLYGWLTHGTSC